MLFLTSFLASAGTLGLELSLIHILNKPMTSYETEVLDMAFGGKETIKIEDLFADYRFDDDLVASYKKKYKGCVLYTSRCV